MMHGVMLAVGRISHENYYSFRYSNIGSYPTLASLLCFGILLYLSQVKTHNSNICDMYCIKIFVVAKIEL